MMNGEFIITSDAIIASTSSRFVIISMLLPFVVTASATNGGRYGSKLELVKPILPKEKLLSSLIGIQGLIYCESGPKHLPLEGAVARITCLGVDEFGYETAPFSILSDATDAKGYFLATLSLYEVQDNWKIKEYKAFLELSPSKSCQFPTDANKGLSGALLSSSSYRFLEHKKMKLFNVGPFCFTSKHPNSVSNNGGY